MLLYGLARAVIAALQALPLRFVARVGRFGGALAYWLDARHRRVILDNLQLCFGAEKSPKKIRAMLKRGILRGFDVGFGRTQIRRKRIPNCWVIYVCAMEKASGSVM